MSFLKPYFLAALLTAAIPLVIHILTRDRIRRTAFSTLRFFVKTSRSVLRRKKVREMILLGLRMLFCALLAVAFARPFLSKDRGSDPGLREVRRARVVVVDVSGSMAGSGMEEAMRKAAAEAVAGLDRGADAAALVTFAAAPKIEVPLGKDLAAIEAAIATLKAGYGATDISEALRKADGMLARVTARSREIVLVSDLQRRGWQAYKGDWKLGPDVSLQIKPVAATTPASVAIIEAECPQSVVADGVPKTLAARIANYGAEDRAVEVTLSLQGRTVDTQKINVRRNADAVVRFLRVFDTAGDNPGTLAIDAADTRAAGASLCFNVRVIPRIKILILNGRPSSRPLEDGAFLLQAALAPSPESPFEVEAIADAEVKPDRIAAAQVVILSGVRSLGEEARAELAALLQRGGGLLFVPGEPVSAEAFNTQFAALAPCKLRQIVSGPLALPVDASSPAPQEIALSDVTFDHPVFEVFQRPHHGNLSAARFLRYWETSEAQLATRLASFGNGRPAMLERAEGQGITMILLAGLDPTWTDWAVDHGATFLACLHQAARYLAIRSEGTTACWVGDPLAIPVGQKLKTPSGTVLRGPQDGQAPGTALAAEPGFHVLSAEDGSGTYTYAVNLRTEEADPARVPADEIVTAVRGVPASVMAGGKTLAADDGDRGDRGMWWFILAALPLLLAGELLLGNTTVRH